LSMKLSNPPVGLDPICALLLDIDLHHGSKNLLKNSILPSKFYVSLDLILSLK
jgi:hypothetical protein